MRQILTQPLLWFVAAAASLLLHVWWAWETKDGMQFARSGASWVVFGGALIARPIIRIGYDAWYKFARIFDGGSFVPSPQEIEEDRQAELDARCSEIRPIARDVWNTTLGIWRPASKRCLKILGARLPLGFRHHHDGTITRDLTRVSFKQRYLVTMPGAAATGSFRNGLFVGAVITSAK